MLPIRIYLAKEHTLQIRAAQHARPVIRLLDWQVDRSDDVMIVGETGSRFTLDGVVVTGRGIRIEGDLASFTVRHSTLVPGWSLQPDCEPWRPAEASISVIDCRTCVVIEHSIVGSIQIDNNEITLDPIALRVSDSIVDATGSDCTGPVCEAIGASDSGRAHANLEIARSTIIGRVMVHRVALAENTIFTSRVNVARSQSGCVRFCYVPPGSRTPRRFHCQPDLVEAAADPDSIGSERERVRPRFMNLRYGMPDYCQLAEDCAAEISAGADDEAEMGVFHDLFQPQRLANLRTRLDEYVPAGTVANVIFAT